MYNCHDQIAAQERFRDTHLSSNNLFSEISQLIDRTKNQVAQKVNASLVLLYWQIGMRINSEILSDKRAEYGEKLIKQLASQLYEHYGRGFNERSLFRMVRFAKKFPQQDIVTTLSPLLSWSHFVELIAFDDPLACQFYTEICHLEHWSVRELRKKINGRLYERTVIAKKPRKLIAEELKALQSHGQCSQSLVFRDPYILDFLNLPANYSEISRVFLSVRGKSSRKTMNYLRMLKKTLLIHVAQYLTALPKQAILEEKLRLAIASAREKYGRLGV